MGTAKGLIEIDETPRVRSLFGDEDAFGISPRVGIAFGKGVLTGSTSGESQRISSPSHAVARQERELRVPLLTHVAARGMLYMRASSPKLSPVMYGVRTSTSSFSPGKVTKHRRDPSSTT